MSVAIRSRRSGHLTFWEEALRAKYLNQGRSFTRVDFDKFLYDYDAIEDIPAILFVDELLEAYPNAKVILTNRDVDSWAQSMEKTFYTVTGWKTIPFISKIDTVSQPISPTSRLKVIINIFRNKSDLLRNFVHRILTNFQKLWGPYTRILHIIMTHWGKGDPSDRSALRQTYIEYYAHVRSVVPRSRLLEFESKDGWRPLCDFLGKDVPDKDYPRSNDAASTVQIHGFLFWIRLVKVSAIPLVTASAVALGVWKFSNW